MLPGDRARSDGPVGMCRGSQVGTSIAQAMATRGTRIHNRDIALRIASVAIGTRGRALLARRHHRDVIECSCCAQVRDTRKLARDAEPQRSDGSARRAAKIRQRLAGDDAEFPERRPPALGGVGQALGDEDADLMIAAIRQHAAGLFQRSFHVGFDGIGQLVHVTLSPNSLSSKLPCRQHSPRNARRLALNHMS